MTIALSADGGYRCAAEWVEAQTGSPGTVRWFTVEELRVVADLPELLIKARIARGLTQKELADRVGLKEQQIQRYGATDYDAAKWSRIREVADVLSMELRGGDPAAVRR